MSTATWEAVWKEVVLYLPRLPVSALILVVFWLGGRLLQGAVIRFGALRRADPNLISFLGRTAKTVILLLGTITALGTVGVDVSSLVAGLGLTGLALGIALKETISNAVSGIMIIIYKPFTSGDRIAVTTFEGVVLEVSLRYTVVDSSDRRVFIPNSLLLTTPVVVETGKGVGP